MILSGLLVNLAVTGIAVALVMGTACAVGVHRGRHDGVDVVWGLAFAAVALLTFGLSHGDTATKILVTLATTVWSLRLATHIYFRNLHKPEDPRYAELMSKAQGKPGWYAFRRIYLTQGAIAWFVSLPVQAAQYETESFGLLGYCGLLIWLVGVAFEVVGDWQLARFKANPGNHGRIMDQGLWRYTRHPNYFGDACVWWGLYFMACQDWLGAITILSPLVMTLLLVKGTGKALTEKTMRQRPGYTDYIQQTSGFFPLPPRRFSP